jgi:hypothetical protein
MKKAGELLSSFFDEETLNKAKGVSRLFSSWASVVAAYRVPAAAAHSRIVEVERHILFVEADHPGWIQILQTKQREFLHEFQRRFPDLVITGIAFRLSSRSMRSSASTNEEDAVYVAEPKYPGVQDKLVEEKDNNLYMKIEDPHLRETFRKLEQDIIVRNNRIKRKNR